MYPFKLETVFVEIDYDIRGEDTVIRDVLPDALESAFIQHTLIRRDVGGFSLRPMRNIGNLEQVFRGDRKRVAMEATHFRPDSWQSNS